MSSSRHVKKLETIVKLATEILEEVRNGVSPSPPKPKRTRRSGKELVSFRKMLKAERKKGVPVAELAERHGVSAAYIYQI